MSVEVPTFRKGLAAAGVWTNVGTLAGVDPAVHFQRAGAHKPKATIGTEIRSTVHGSGTNYLSL